MCCGCEHVFAQSVSTDSESYTSYYNHLGEVEYEHDETVVMWPAKAKRERPEWFDGDTIESEDSTFDLDASLRELYGALDHNLNVLASISIRTSFGIASRILGVNPEKPFQEKVQDLVDGGSSRNPRKSTLTCL